MSAHRINIIGASGVGKTTLGRALAARLAVPFFDADDYFHVPTDPPYREQRTPEERRSLLERDLGPLDSWVLAGGAGTWTPAPALRYTLHVFLWLPAELRIARIRERERALYRDRILPGGDMAADHQEFMDWTHGYDASTSEGTNTLAHHEALFQRADCPVLRLTEPMSTEDAVARALSILP